jgi:hypothetical protein
VSHAWRCRWLVKFNRREQARAVLQKLRKREDVSEELSQIEVRRLFPPKKTKKHIQTRTHARNDDAG